MRSGKVEKALTMREERRMKNRETVRIKNEPPRLTAGEEIVNTLSHALGAGLAVAAMVLLLLRSRTGLEIMASCFYGVSMVLMLMMSSVYHALPAGSSAKRICRRFDYLSIYLLIGGTYAPILLVYLGGRLGVALFCLQWCVIITGVVLVSVFGPGRWRWLHFTLYFTMGWLGVMFVPSFLSHAPMLLWFVLAGGVVYTLGMIPFARHRPYNHCIWHMYVLLAAVLHWFGIYTQIY